MSDARVYAGVPGAERRAQRRARLLGAALTLLASDEGADALSVRGACREAGLASRYFYESFADVGELAATVYDAAVADLTDATLTALSRATQEDVPALTRVGVDSLVGRISEDPRLGRLLFAPGLAALPAIAERRAASTRTFVQLLGEQARAVLGLGPGPARDVAAELLVGGLAQSLSAWTAGDLDADRATLVDLCAAMFVAVGSATTRAAAAPS